VTAFARQPTIRTSSIPVTARLKTSSVASGPASGRSRKTLPLNQPYMAKSYELLGRDVPQNAIGQEPLRHGGDYGHHRLSRNGVGVHPPTLHS
jgi:hypothetical protein